MRLSGMASNIRDEPPTDPDYDLHVRERADGNWGIALPRRRTSVASAPTLDEALRLCAEMAPNGYARVRHKTGKVGIVQLKGPSSKSKSGGATMSGSGTVDNQ